ncbi:MAG: hypothetical protein JNL21_11845 [Myxococcales bacterium]|nr:hypothetical protein [Myxococcales bacterium]
MKRSRWGVVGLVLLGTSALAGLGKAAPDMVRAAEASDTACADAPLAARTGTRNDCEWKARAWLAVPKVVPWTRESALAMEQYLDYLKSARALRQASRVAPEAAKRDDAAARVRDAARTAPWSLARENGIETVDPRRGLPFELVAAGAYREATQLTGLDAESTKIAFDAALQLGELQTALAIADGRAEIEPEIATRAGALRCLLGEHKAGLELLDRVASRAGAGGRDRAAVARAACGGQVSGSRTDLDAEVVAALLLTESAPAPDIEGRFRGDERRAELTPIVAAWLMAHDRSTSQAVDAIAHLSRPLDAASMPREIETVSLLQQSTPLPVAIAPETHERAAERLAVMMTDLSSKPDKDRKSPPAEPVTSVSPDVVKARKNPTATLRQAARRLLAEAAIARATLGDHRAAQRDVERLLDLEDDVAAELLALRVAMVGGDLDRAKIHVAALARLTSPAEDTQGALDEALLALREARWEDAHALAKRAHTSAKGSAADEATWLLVMTSMRVGRPEEAPATPAAVRGEGATMTWGRLAALPEEQRRAVRAQLEPFGWVRGAEGARAAMYYAVGQAAGGTDVEVFLDSMFSPAFVSGSPGILFVLRARAEAARWRGDEVSAKGLGEVARSIQALANSPAKLVLARVAGLM